MVNEKGPTDKVHSGQISNNKDHRLKSACHSPGTCLGTVLSLETCGGPEPTAFQEISSPGITAGRQNSGVSWLAAWGAHMPVLVSSYLNIYVGNSIEQRL